MMKNKLAIFAVAGVLLSTSVAYACPPGDNDLRNKCNDYRRLVRSNSDISQYYYNKWVIDGCNRVMDLQTGNLK